jgi:hypothetical protein
MGNMSDVWIACDRWLKKRCPEYRADWNGYNGPKKQQKPVLKTPAKKKKQLK